MIGRKTLIEFQEELVRWTVGRIDKLFQGHGFAYTPLAPDKLPSGERRSNVECYYAGIESRDPEHESRLLHVFEDVLDHKDTTQDSRTNLLRHLERDGYRYFEGRLMAVSDATSPLRGLRSTTLDTAHLNIYLSRIATSVENDPSLAIGSSKELLEATLKTILSGVGAPAGEKEEIPQLLKRCQKALALTPDDISDSARGADIVRRTLSNLGAVVIGIAELRNLYGSGHGRTGKGLPARHARLVVGSAGALCRFLLDTYEARTIKGA